MFCHLKVFLFLCIVGMVLVVNIIFFSKLPKFRSNIFLLWITHRGTPSGKGQSPVERPHSTPSPTPNHISTANIVTFGMPLAYTNQKNRPFGLWLMWFAWNQTCRSTNGRCEAQASLKGCFLCFLFQCPSIFPFKHHYHLLFFFQNYQNFVPTFFYYE